MLLYHKMHGYLKECIVNINYPKDNKQFSDAWNNCFDSFDILSCIEGVLGASDCGTCICDVLEWLGLMTCWAMNCIKHVTLSNKALTVHTYNYPNVLIPKYHDIYIKHRLLLVQAGPGSTVCISQNLTFLQHSLWHMIAPRSNQLLTTEQLMTKDKWLMS